MSHLWSLVVDTWSLHPYHRLSQLTTPKELPTTLETSSSSSTSLQQLTSSSLHSKQDEHLGDLVGGSEQGDIAEELDAGGDGVGDQGEEEGGHARLQPRDGADGPSDDGCHPGLLLIIWRVVSKSAPAWY